MGLRKEFEKDHPIPAKLTNLPNERHFSPEYVEWLEQRIEAGQHETIVMRLKWPDVHFVIKYMIENINTERIDVDDQYDIEKLTDTVFSEYQNWKNKKDT